MRSKWITRLGLASTLALAALGCAQEREPINRVQANALAKSFFVGAALHDSTDDPEFYMRGTIVDVGYGAAQDGLFTATYSQPLTRIKWEIAEDLLMARLTYERIQDSDHHGSKTTDNGQLVAAFRIQSHFDIKRDYNPQTGEELNVIVENGSDRPWYDREFFRVDWSRNMVTDSYDFDTMASLSWLGGIRYDSLSYYVEDPGSPDAPVFDGDNGYFDVTNKVYATPQDVPTPLAYQEFIKSPTIPACILDPDHGGGSPTANCNPVELKIRLSFRKFVDKDYEPMEWDGDHQNAFGIFTTDRMGYARNYGMNDDKWHRFASRYNIWAKSHADAACGTTTADPHRDLDGTGGAGDGTEDECQAVGPGSRCDALTQKCTIPFSQRTPVTIAWHYGLGADMNMFDPTNRATKEWDVAMRKAVQSARLIECRRTSGASAGVADAASCSGKYPMDDAAVMGAIQPMVTLCHNPVADGDDQACGPVGTIARVGDLRYNSVNLIQDPQTPSPWGIMVDADDPLTGEKVQTSVNVWNYVNDVAAQGGVDIIRWLNGELTPAEITDGTYVANWVAANDKKGSFWNSPTIPTAQVERRIAAMRPTTTAGSDAVRPRVRPDYKMLKSTELEQAGAAAFRQIYGQGGSGSSNAKIAARLNASMGSQLETELTTSKWLEASNLDPATTLSEDTVAAASPIRGNNVAFHEMLRADRARNLAARGACLLEAPEPTGLPGMAAIFAKKWPYSPPPDPGTAESPAAYATAKAAWDKANEDRVAKMVDYLRRNYQYAVVAHEMGHSIGLRHNFVSSYDAMNFRPQYWQLRTNNGQLDGQVPVSQGGTYCDAQTADGTTCVGPRWYDPLTKDEIDNMIWMWQQDTVMDYPGDPTQDTLGLGTYDFAAARFYYANVVDTWATPGDEDGSEVGGTLKTKIDDFGGIGGPWAFKGGSNQFADALHYSQLGGHLHLVTNCQPVTPTPPADWNTDRDGVWDPVFDGHIVLNSKCDEPARDFADWRDMQTDAAAQNNPGSRKVEKGTGRVRWPLMFASDEYADIGNVAVFRHDNGADPYEQFTFYTNVFENRHIFDNFRRNRTNFSFSAAFNRSQSRYHEKIRESTKGFALFHDYFLPAIGGQPAVDAYEQTDGALRPNAIAASLAFDHFTRILTRPQSGNHVPGTTILGRQMHISRDDYYGNASSDLVIPNGTMLLGDGSISFGGRPLNNALSSNHGYYDVEYETQVGDYYDKTLSIMNLTNSEDRFISQSRFDFVDGRYRNLSFANIFPEGFRRLVANALTEDGDLLGPRIPANSSGQPDVWSETDPNPLMPKSAIGFVSFWPKAGPDVCFPTNGSTVCSSFPDEGTAAGNIGNNPPANTVVVDPQIGWEIQKFIVYYTLLYLPENWKMDWIQQFRIYETLLPTDHILPGMPTIQWRDPVSGMLYVAHSFGTEQVLGRTVQKGIAARVLEFANALTAKAYQVDSVDPATLRVEVKRDANGLPLLSDPSKECKAIQSCAHLTGYKSLVEFIMQTSLTFGFPAPELKAVN